MVSHIEADIIEQKDSQLQGLLRITRAINQNISAEELYKMYRDILHTTFGIKEVVLFIKHGNQWRKELETGSIGLPDSILPGKIIGKYPSLHVINTEESEIWLHDFDLIITISHKDQPIAFSLLKEIPRQKYEESFLNYLKTLTSFIAVAVENKRLFKNQLTQERLNKELELAEKVQRKMIPEVHSTPQYDIAALYMPHEKIGGDYYDVIVTEQGHTIICIADVTGKGVGAALIMSNIQAIIRTHIHREEDLAIAVKAVNKALFEITDGDRFVSLFIAVIEPKEKRLAFINAGHNYPLYLTKEGQVTELKKGCSLLGIDKSLGKLESEVISIEEGAVLFCYTDGLIEVIPAEKVIDLLLSGTKNDPDHINSKISELISGKSVFPDDIAFLTIKFK